MSAPNDNRGQGSSRSSPPHIVQTILESFTRCLAPIDECSSPSNHNNNMDLGGNNSSGIAGSAASATGGCDGSRAAAAAVSLSISSSNDSKNSKSRSNNNNNNNVMKAAPRPRSTTAIASTTTNNNNKGRSRKSNSSGSSSSTRPIPTAEELNERSMKRKLEIFRGSGASGGTSSSRNTTTGGSSSSSSNNLVVQQQQQNNNNNNNRGRQSPQTSDDDEEILRLTQQNSRYRFGNPFGYVGGGCGLGHLPSHDNNDLHDVSSNSPNRNSNSSPLFTNLGRQMGRFGCGTTTGSGGRWSPPGFLCFATPVRSNSDDGGEGGEYGDHNLAHLSDDKLTADEFLSRHGGIGGNTNNSAHAAPLPPKQVSPEHGNTNSSNDGRNSAMSNQNGGTGGSVYTEMSGTDAQTIESTLYFDQKYSHVIQTRPPMPLFQENIVTSCGEESYSYCGGGTTSIGGVGANNNSGGSSSSFLFGEGLFSGMNNNNNNVVVGNEISTIIKKRTSSQQCEIDRAQQREMDRTIAAGLSNNMNYEYNSHTRR